MAHFRKYYANNTALSFSLPPRSTIMGMLAALLGLERDSYYQTLSSEHLQVGVRVLAPVKKSFHRLNYLKVESSSEFRGRNGRIQVPVEVVTGLHPAQDWVRYRLYLAAGQQGHSLELIEKHLLQQGSHYALSFGAAPFAARLKHWQSQEAQSMEPPTQEGIVHLHSAVPAQHVQRIAPEVLVQGTFRQIEEELMPADFVANGNREVRHMNRLLFSTDGQPMPVIMQQNYWQLPASTIEGAEPENISFLV